MRLLIAIDENNGSDSILSEHFGHCPYFAIYETETEKLEIVKNELDHSNQNMTPVDQVMVFNPDVVFSKGMGQRAIKLFNEKNVEIKTGEYGTVREVVENLEDLEELDSGCIH